FRDQCAGSAARGGFLCLLESGADYSLSGLPQSNDRVREDWSVSPVRKEDLRVVDSPQNASVRRARALERDRALRERLKTYVAWGRHIALEALASRATIHQAFVGPGLLESDEGRDISRLLRERGVPVMRVTTR